MTDMKPWAFELEEYIREGEPDRARRAELWQVAIGLQDVDGLTPSQYLLDTAKEHIEGELSIDQVQSRIAAYYQQRDERTQAELESEEADVVSSRIAEILGERAFTFSPSELKSIHGRLFKGLLKEAGAYRRYNITKNEWVLKGDTVRYSSWNIVPETLEYDFEKEGAFSYQGLSKLEVTRHIAAFASGIWQIHPFCEGNTRTTAVFIIKYLNAMGLEIGNGPFADHSWYFRNALVRAIHYLDQDVHETNPIWKHSSRMLFSVRATI
ncbi:MAG: Fic family protein [Adlercreutzia sp.]